MKLDESVTCKTIFFNKDVMNKHLQRIQQMINVMKILIIPHELAVKVLKTMSNFFFVN